MPAPGNNSRTAVARMCADEWRSRSIASGSRSVTIATVASASMGRSRSHTVPFTCAASAARASPGADRLGDLARGGARRHLTDAAVGQRDPHRSDSRLS